METGMRVCDVDGCGRKHYGRGLCIMHWNRQHRHGDVAALPKEGVECIIWPYYILDNGYARYGKGTASRYICEKFHGPPPTPKHQAAHSCGNGKSGCIAPYHVRWKTPSANNKEKRKHGTAQIGERHPSAKLTRKDVKRVRELAPILPRSEIARRYKVTVPTIAAIINGKTWK